MVETYATNQCGKQIVDLTEQKEANCLIQERQRSREGDGENAPPS